MSTLKLPKSLREAVRAWNEVYDALHQPSLISRDENFLRDRLNKHAHSVAYQLSGFLKQKP